ncbi:hypothetical protein XA68_10095 [Ophiocordyceps unilateralis]|uniref:PH domain-containing protein n=1 Tax=Ophiocordyceps unilateralis TaxID=268505 RepID=A0A2A9PP89_OPHUN|nr:hypothetical protein XA68_10095 [Ophiocordyceps unilateralis]
MDPTSSLESRAPPSRQATQTPEPNLHQHHHQSQAAHQQQQQQQQQTPRRQQQKQKPQPSSQPEQQSQQQPSQKQPLLQKQQQQQNSPPRGSPAPDRFNEDRDANQRSISVVDGQVRSRSTSAMQRSGSLRSFATGDDRSLPVRSNTLRKRTSMRRSSSRRSNRAGSVRSLAVQTAPDSDDVSNAFYCPVPTSGTPTDVLANRFQVWRKILKDVIAYFREIQSHYEQRAKSLFKLVNLGNNIATPPNFLSTGGIDDALQLLRKHNHAALQEASKAKEIEDDVILALTGLRSDLQQKIKEIRHLAGDFKNSVDREIEGTQKAVRALADALEKTEIDSAFTTGKQDPYLLRLAVDQQVERQIDEENYLHQAHLNLEGSGRELESIVVGEIQKAYNAYAGILKREAENAYNAVEELRQGPINMPKDQEWNHFVKHDDQIIDPNIPMRSADQIHYPGQDHVAASEIRAGLLERKSKYLKSYTAGWYVLSATHLHEFKSADKAQAPVMSLYLPEQKLGSHSAEGGASNKFVLKGRQTGAMHRGHTWVFRAESHDTMMAWYDDIQLEPIVAPIGQQRRHRRRGRRGAIRGQPDRRRPRTGTPTARTSVNTGRQEETLDAHAIAVSGAAYAASSGSEEHGQQEDHGRRRQHHQGHGGMDGGMPSQAAVAGYEGHGSVVKPANGDVVQKGGGKSPNSGGLARPSLSPTSVKGERPVSDDDRARYMDERKMIDAEVEARGVDSNSSGLHGAYCVNGGAVTDLTSAGSVPRSEKRMSLPEARIVAHAMAKGEATPPPLTERPVAEVRTDSAATLSNLPMPGRFPRRGGGVLSST